MIYDRRIGIRFTVVTGKSDGREGKKRLPSDNRLRVNSSYLTL